MGGLSLVDALDYLVILVEIQPERAAAAAVRWHGRLSLESNMLTPHGVAANARRGGEHLRRRRQRSICCVGCVGAFGLRWVPARGDCNVNGRRRTDRARLSE